MHKEEVLFQPWAMWYHQIYPDKMIGNTKAVTVTKDFAGQTSLAAVSQPPNVLRQLSGSMTNNLFSSLRAHRKTVTVLEG